MKLIIDVRFLDNILEKLLIFTTIFYTFFASVVGRFTNNIMLLIVLPLTFLAISIFRQEGKCSIPLILTYIVLGILILANVTIFNVKLSNYVLMFMLVFMPMMISAYLIDLNKYYHFIFCLAGIYITFLFIYMVFVYMKVSTVSSDHIDYMGFSYYAIPSLLIVIYEFHRSKSLSSLAFTILGIFYLGICGTRGPILCTFLFTTYCISQSIHKNSVKTLIASVVALIFGFVLLIHIRSIAIYLYPIFVEHRFSTRLLNFFIQQTGLTEGTGRSDIYARIWNEISNHFITGSGLMSDRELFGGNESMYSHNIVLEIINSFGFPLGIILLIGLTVLIASALHKTSSRVYRDYIVIYICGTIVKLLMSSSFMQESAFFVLLGICYGALSRVEVYGIEGTN